MDKDSSVENAKNRTISAAKKCIEHTSIPRKRPKENILEVENLVKKYGSVTALENFNLAVEKGEVFGLLGPNGSGKTTMLNCIMQLLSYDSGSIRVFGEKITPSSSDLKRRIGVVPQNVAVFEEFSVYENIDFFCSLYVKERRRRKKLVNEAIEFVGLQEFTKFRPRKLSGGLLRRLNIACGIVHQPDLIFFDEPTVAVDPQSRNAILEGIVELNRAGSTIVYTSHYMEEVEIICSRIMIMNHGETLAEGTSNELKKLVDMGERIEIAVDERKDEVLRLLEMKSNCLSAEYTKDGLLVVCKNAEHNLSSVIEELDNCGVSYGRVYCEPPTLNDVFLSITGKELRD